MIKHIIFDLGNVLIDIHLKETLERFASSCNLPVSKIQNFFRTDVYFDHMKGLYPSEEFYQKVLQEYPCSLTDKEFKELWNGVIGKPKDGIESLLHELRSRYTLSVCSNTDPWHWEKVMKEIPFMGVFSHNFLSFKLNLNKPDPRVFYTVLQQLQSVPEECLFFDDTADNIEQAHKIGIQAIQTSEPDAIRKELVSRGLL